MLPRFALLVGVLASASAAAAEPVTLRIATIAPDGTAYAREARALGRDLETETGGQVRIKWYFGGVAGNEMQMLDRIKRDQLDGAVSAGMMCRVLAPTMRVFGVLGLFQS